MCACLQNSGRVHSQKVYIAVYTHVYHPLYSLFRLRLKFLVMLIAVDTSHHEVDHYL